MKQKTDIARHAILQAREFYDIALTPAYLADMQKRIAVGDAVRVGKRGEAIVWLIKWHGKSLIACVMPSGIIAAFFDPLHHPEFSEPPKAPKITAAEKHRKATNEKITRALREKYRHPAFYKLRAERNRASKTSPVQARVYNRLALTPGALVTRAELMDAVWPDPNKQPDNPHECLRAAVSKLKARGLPIGSVHGRGHFLDCSVAASADDLQRTA